MLMKIHELDPSAVVCIIGDNRWGALNLMEAAPFIQNIYDITNENTKSVKNWVNNNGFDAVLIAVDGGVPSWLNKIFNQSNCKKICIHIRANEFNTISFNKWYLNFFNKPDNLCFVPKLQGRHEIDVNYDLLEAFLNAPFERTYSTWTPEYSGDVNITLKRFNIIPQKYICFQVCAANGNPTPKIWDHKNFIDLFKQLKQSHPHIDIVIIGDEDDFNNYIKKIDWPDYVIQTASQTDLGEMTCLISNARCVVAHDSGIMHIANALKVNLIALYGPTDFTWTKPMGKNTEILFSRNDAFSCMYNERLSETEAENKYQNFYAMSGISVKDVMDSLQPFMYKG